MAFNSLADFKIPEFEDKNVVEGDKQSSKVVLVPVDKIEIWEEQPRNYIDPQEVSELAKSIEQYEQIAPIVVRPHPSQKNKYLIVAGEKRYLACKEAGRTEIESKIRSDLDDTSAYEIALVENRKRSGLNPIDDTIGTLVLIEKKTKVTREKIINYLHKIGNKQDEEVPIDFWEAVNSIFNSTCNISINTFVKKKLRLLKLPDFILEPIQKRQISGENAPCLGKLADKNKEKAKELIQQAILEKWSKRQVEEEVKKILSTEFVAEKTASTVTPEETKSNLQRVYKKINSSKTLLSDSRKKRKLDKLILELERLLDN